MSHKQFTRDNRVELATLLRVGKSKRECARDLGFDEGALGREIKRNKDPDGIYRAVHADKRAMKRRAEAKEEYRLIENTTWLRQYIVRKLRIYWSPEQIAGRLKKDKGRVIISHETIYAFVYDQRKDLIKYLRHHKSKWRKKRGTITRIEANKASKVRRIGERPEIVNERTRVGDWEDDTVIGKEKKQRILTKVERVSGLGLADKLTVVSAQIVEQKTVAKFQHIPKKVRHTLTRDNGSEFGDFDQDVERKTGLKVYRATPYHSWERGSNENWNGLLRQFFPKSMYFATITQADVDEAVELLNNRPRKRLGYATPREVFRKACNSG